MLRPTAIYLTVDDLYKLDKDKRNCEISNFVVHLGNFKRSESYYLHNKNTAAYYICSENKIYKLDDIWSKIFFPRPVLQFNQLNWNKEWNDKDEVELGFFPQSKREINENDVNKYSFTYHSKHITAITVAESFSDAMLMNYGNDRRRNSFFCSDIGYYRLCIDKNNDKKYVVCCDSAFEIEPIRWIVDRENKRLICKNLILPSCFYKDGLISIEDLISEIYDSRLDKFLRRINKKEAKIRKADEKFQKVVDKYSVPEEKFIEETIDNVKTADFKKIMNEIDSLLEYYYGDFDVLGYVNKLVDDYNSKIKELNEKDESPILSLDETDRSKLYATLIYDLNQVTDKLKKNIEYFKDYREMLDIIHNCQKNPVEMDKERDDISSDFYVIKSCVLPFLQDKSFEDKLNSILTDEETNLVDVLKKVSLFDSKEVVDLLPLSELKRLFALKMTPFFKELDKKVKEKNIIDEMKKSYIEIGEQKYKTEKKSSITFYLVNLNQLFGEILKTGNEKDINDAKSIVEEEVDMEKPFSEVIDDLSNKIKSLNNIILNINKRKSNNDDLINVDSIKKTH